MSAAHKLSVPKVIDLPLGIGLALTVAFYGVILQPPFHGSLLHRYTTEHAVEYAVVAFFIWGLVDVVFHVVTFPGEFLALRREWLSRRMGREPASRAGGYLARLRQLPPRLLRSRIGKRYVQALAYVDEKGAADDLAEQLRYLADQDFEQTQGNYALLRFICWVMPMFGFLGTVVHFGTALAGQTATSIGENLPKVVAEMGTAFNTTTAALTGATTMMFAVFLCDRIEKGIVLSIDERINQDLLNRFETADPSIAPFLDALRESNRTTLEAMNAAVAEQLEVWSRALAVAREHAHGQGALQSQAWAAALERLEQRFDENDEKRDERFVRLMQTLHEQGRSQVAAGGPTAEQVASLKADLGRFVDALTLLLEQRKELLELQGSLADNLQLLRETRHIDQAVHGLTAAIHLLTARGHSSGEARAA